MKADVNRSATMRAMWRWIASTMLPTAALASCVWLSTSPRPSAKAPDSDCDRSARAWSISLASSRNSSRHCATTGAPLGPAASAAASSCGISSASAAPARSFARAMACTPSAVLISPARTFSLIAATAWSRVAMISSASRCRSAKRITGSSARAPRTPFPRSRFDNASPASNAPRSFAFSSAETSNVASISSNERRSASARSSATSTLSSPWSRIALRIVFSVRRSVSQASADALSAACRSWAASACFCSQSARALAFSASSMFSVASLTWNSSRARLRRSASTSELSSPCARIASRIAFSCRRVATRLSALIWSAAWTRARLSAAMADWTSFS